MEPSQAKIRTTVLCLPVSDPDRTLAYYRNVFGYRDAEIEEGIIALELPNLSLFLMEKDAFETYSRKAGRDAQLPGANAGMAISCAMETREAVDAMLEAAPMHGGSVPGKAAMDEMSGGYTGYVSDPDGHLWELVFPEPRTEGS
ncbi:VOC family protein [Chelativorans xinjiangense]|uniref:VOC family protein n=1 Tax=Chelativorans xinjiangense TaxID=2681485 RepID=UPI00135A2BC6|nr:VOC family protein [Chelativorans xinjiangense]